MKLIGRLKEIGSKRYEISTRLRKSNLSPEDRAALLFLLRVAAGLGRLLEKKIVTVERLRLLFASKTESSAKILREIDREADSESSEKNDDNTAQDQAQAQTKSKGHGRLGAKAYAAASTRIEIKHESLKAGDRCPECGRGKLYRHLWGLFLKFIGQPFIRAVVYAQEKLRCNACGMIFAAKLPSGVADGPAATHEARAMVPVLRYGSGMPHWRLAKLQEALGVPLPPSTQWDMMRGLFEESVRPVWNRLIWWAAQGEVIHNDDTTAKVLEIIKQIELEKKQEKQSAEKRSKKAGVHNKIYTSGILSKLGTRKILLLFTGRRAMPAITWVPSLRCVTPLLARPYRWQTCLRPMIRRVRKPTGLAGFKRPPPCILKTLISNWTSCMSEEKFSGLDQEGMRIGL